MSTVTKYTYEETIKEKAEVDRNGLFPEESILIS